MNKLKMFFMGGLFITFFFNSTKLIGQIKNSEAKTVASFFNAKTKRIELSGGETSFKVRVDKKYGTYFGKRSKDTSAVKITGLFVKGGITETKKFIDVNDFDFSEKNGFLVGVELINSFNKIYKNKGYRTHNLKTYKISLTGSYKRVKVLDTVSGNIKNETPFNLNASASFGYLRFRWKYKKIIAYPQLNLGYNIITYNEKELKAKFAQTQNASIDEDILIVNDSFDGVVGDYRNDAQVLDVSLSFPLITDYEHKWIPNFMLVPYTSFQHFSYLDKPTFNTGASINILGKKIFGKKVYLKKEENISNSDNAQKRNYYQEFTPPSFLNFGVDWAFQDGSRPSKPNFYISGSFNID